MATLPDNIAPSRLAHYLRWALQFAVAAWVVVFCVIAFRVVLWPERNTVYPIYTDAAENWVKGTNLYDEHFLVVGIDQYRYSPLVAASFVPFSYLPDAVGAILWRLLSASVYFGGIACFCRTVYPGLGGVGKIGAASLAWLLMPLSLSSINNGQANTIVTGLMLLAIVAVVKERWNWAAAALAGAVLFKLYPIALALLLILAYPRALGWRFVLLVAAGLLIPFALQRPAYVSGQYGEWFNYLIHEDRHERMLTDSYRDFQLLLRWSGCNLSVREYYGVQFSAAAAIAGFVLLDLWRGRPVNERLRRLYDLGCCWIILFGPTTENCTYIMLAPTMAIAVWEGYTQPRSLWTRGLLAAIVGAVVAGALVKAFPGGRNIVYLLNPTAALLLFAERLVDLARPVRIVEAASQAELPRRVAA